MSMFLDPPEAASPFDSGKQCSWSPDRLITKWHTLALLFDFSFLVPAAALVITCPPQVPGAGLAAAAPASSTRAIKYTSHKPSPGVDFQNCGFETKAMTRLYSAPDKSDLSGESSVWPVVFGDTVPHGVRVTRHPVTFWSHST